MIGKEGKKATASFGRGSVRRISAVALLVCMLFALLPSATAADMTTAADTAAAENSVALSVGQATAERGEEITVDILMDSGEKSVTAWQFSLSYDEKVLTYQKAVHCPEDGKGQTFGFFSTQSQTYGYPLTVGCTFQPPAAATGKTVITRITFSVSRDAAPGSYPITIEECKNGGSTLVWKNGTENVRYTPVYTPGGVTVTGDLALHAEALPQNTPLQGGETLTVRYFLENPKALPVESYSFHLVFDEVFTLRELRLPERLGEKTAAGSTSVADKLAVCGAEDGAFSESGVTLLTAVFTVNDGAPDGSYRVGAILTAEDGLYAPTPEGAARERYATELSPLTVEVRKKPLTLGDADGDGRVTATDRNAIARYLAGWKGYTEKELSIPSADADGDGRVTPVDRNILARHLAGWNGYGTLPYTKTA